MTPVSWYGDSYALALNFNRGPKAIKSTASVFRATWAPSTPALRATTISTLPVRIRGLSPTTVRWEKAEFTCTCMLKDDPFSLLPYLKKWFDDNKDEIDGVGSVSGGIIHPPLPSLPSQTGGSRTLGIKVCRQCPKFMTRPTCLIFHDTIWLLNSG